MNSITGKIIHVLNPVTGESRKNPGTTWMRQEYVLETFDQYPRKVCFQLWGEDRIRTAAIEMDDVVTVEFDIESREYQGRWYTSINGRVVTKGDTTQGGVTPNQMNNSSLPGTDNTFGAGADNSVDDLPF